MIKLQILLHKFAENVREGRPQLPGKKDFSTSGDAAPGLLVIPRPLREHVESISVAPLPSS